MVSILCRRCRQRLCLDHENWATMSAPATKSKRDPPQSGSLLLFVVGGAELTFPPEQSHLQGEWFR
jgi:hypothetical protein